MDARLDAAAQRLEEHGDDHRGYNGVERSILLSQDSFHKIRQQQCVRDREHGGQHRRKGTIDEGAVEYYVYVPQMVAQDRDCDGQWYEEKSQINYDPAE